MKAQFSRHFLILVIMLLTYVLSTTPSTAKDIDIEFDKEAWDMAIDWEREQIYVSVPEENEIVIVSMETQETLQRISTLSSTSAKRLSQNNDVLVGTRPHGLDISLDGSTLFVALNQASTVAYLNLDTLELENIVIGAELGDARTWDVIEGRPNRVFVSSNPGSNGFAYITMIRRDQDNIAERVAGSTIIRARPVFARSEDGQTLYVGTGFSPNSLYKLDISDDAAPIVLEDDHGSVSGTHALEVSPDGELIFLGSGQVLRTSDFIQIGMTESGIPRMSEDGSQVYVVNATGTVKTFETKFFSMINEVQLPCSFTNLRKFELLNDGEGFLLLGDNRLCGSSEFSISSFQINSGLNDAWVSPDAAGQGVFVNVLPDFGKIFLAIFTYDSVRPQSPQDAILGEPGHRWVTALGDYSGDEAVLEAELTAGGVFDSATPTPVQTLEYGTITLKFMDCNSLLLSYEFPSTGLTGTMDLTRATNDNVALCEVLNGL